MYFKLYFTKSCHFFLFSSHSLSFDMLVGAFLIPKRSVAVVRLVFTLMVRLAGSSDLPSKTGIYISAPLDITNNIQPRLEGIYPLPILKVRTCQHRATTVHSLQTKWLCYNKSCKSSSLSKLLLLHYSSLYPMD